MATTVVEGSRAGDKIVYQNSGASDASVTIDLDLEGRGHFDWFVGVDYFLDEELTVELNTAGESTGNVNVVYNVLETISTIPIGAIDVSDVTDRRVSFIGCPESITINPDSVPGGNFVRVRATGKSE